MAFIGQKIERRITQAISTRYFRATDKRSAYIKATAFGGSLTIPRIDGLDYQDAHRAAAEALITKMGWSGKFAQGSNTNGSGFYFVNIEGA